MAKHGDLIVDNGVTWKLMDNRINGTIADSPCFYKRSSLFKVSNGASSVIITTPTKLLININNHGYIATSSTINIDSVDVWDPHETTYATQVNRAGKDFYIYAVEQDTSDAPKWVISSNSTCPTGYTENNSRKVGGFHCLCADVGTIENHPLSGYKAGWILPLSVWDLKHRPASEPEGMVWVEGINKWVDVYLPSWSTEESKLVSIYHGAVADGGEQNGKRWDGGDFLQEFGLIGKHLPMRDDFLVFAKGSNEETAVGWPDPVYTGGHVDTEGRRMISNYGIEDCCGYLYQWTSNLVSGGTEYRAYVGGEWGEGNMCGSRRVSFYSSSNSNDSYSARAVSEPRRFE